jgi:hypothetical protein
MGFTTTTRKLLSCLTILAFTYFLFTVVVPAAAQTADPLDELDVATDGAEFATDSANLATGSAEIATDSAVIQERQKLETIKKEDITRPEEPEEKGEFFELFSRRPIDRPNIFNIVGFTVQFAVNSGVPANTVILILLLPILASIAAFIRHVIGLPVLGIIVPVALSITLVATGLTTGAILLTTILLGTIFIRMLLKPLRIMHMPKMSLSILLVSGLVFVTLIFGALNGLLVVKQLSIFPVLLLILLSERFLAVQINRKNRETLVITLTNLFLGVFGSLLLSSQMVRETVVLYPELILLLIPVNVLIGRYFGLRLTEYFRFKTILDHYGR